MYANEQTGLWVMGIIVVQAKLRIYSTHPLEKLHDRKKRSAVGVFGSHEDAESAVKELIMSGYDMKPRSMPKT